MAGPSFAAAIAAAKAGAPMSNGSVPILQGRTLLCDGDGLAYYCSGKDDTEAGQARRNLIDKVQSAQRACGAESVLILLTARGSHKGHRYAVARVKPYQGQRKGKSRPKNWEYLRGLMEEGSIGGIPVEQTSIAEADDLFSRYAAEKDVVIYTQDKDMRMVPGWHLNWLTHIMFHLPADAPFHVHHEDLRWGRGWFWSQMLHGDDADHIPGLPEYRDGSTYSKTHKDKALRGTVKTMRCGEDSSAVKSVLPNLSSDRQCIIHIGALYETCYGDRWVVEMLEQGILLWMRNDKDSDPFNVTAVGNPLHALTNHAFWPAAEAEVRGRINEAQAYAETQDHGSGGPSERPAEQAVDAVCAVPAPVQPGQCGPGPRPLDGDCPPVASSGLQCSAGQGGEQLQAVRGDEPFRIPAWVRKLLAASRLAA